MDHIDITDRNGNSIKVTYTVLKQIAAEVGEIIKSNQTKYVYASRYNFEL